MDEKAHVVDVNRTTDVLAPETASESTDEGIGGFISCTEISIEYTSGEANDNERSSLATDQSYEITEDMLLKKDYNADPFKWYDRKESYNSTLFRGDDTLQKKEAELAKRLTQKDGTLMTYVLSKKPSQLTVDNAQWEDRQLLRFGAIRETEVKMEFVDEDEEKVFLLEVHDPNPPFLDGMMAYTEQAQPVMPIKDPTSDMTIISRKRSSSLIREIHEKQSMNKSRQCFWEFVGSKFGHIP